MGLVKKVEVTWVLTAFFFGGRLLVGRDRPVIAFAH